MSSAYRHRRHVRRFAGAVRCCTRNRTRTLPGMPGAVGRETELGVVDRLLGDVEERLRALVVVGEPGVGKTTVWREAIDRARLRGLRVLAASPSESEASLSFAALTDLLADVGAEVLERLPAPQ